MTSSTFLFTDIEGSTRLWERDVASMAAINARHDALVAEVVGRYRGHVVNSRAEGDSAFVVFDAASDAAAAAVELQRTIASEPWPGGVAVRVRMAIHTGPVSERADNAYGPVVNRCARLRGIGHGGQTLVSEESRTAIGNLVPEGVAFVALGRHRLKDLPTPELVYQLCHPTLPSEFPPLRSVDVVRHNLPVFASDVVGRDDDVAEVVAAVRSGRAVTVVGTGGVGKTTLAVASARRALDGDVSSAWFIDLAAVPDAGLVTEAVAAAMGVAATPGTDAVDAIAARVGHDDTLLVLDNCDHVLEGCAALVGDLTGRAPGARFLSTSRERLAVAGERVVHLAPLTPQDAVALFTRLLRDADVSVTDTNRGAVEQLCAAVDGVPLAIEIVAAAVAAGGLDEVVAGFSAAATLRDTIAWSHDTLDERERALFRRVGVFSGGFTLVAAEAIVAEHSLDTDDVIDALARIIDKSLVVVNREVGVARYRMLDSIREYALEMLAVTEEVDRTFDAHLRFFHEATLAEAPRIRSGAVDALDWVATEIDNVRSALHRADAAAEPRLTANLAMSLFRFWDARGHWREAEEWLDRAAAVEPTAAGRAEALGAAAFVAERRGDFAGAEAKRQRALDGWRSVLAAAASGEPVDDDSVHMARLGIAGTLSDLGHLAARAGRLGDADRLVREALDTRRAIGGDIGVAISLNHLGFILQRQGQLADAAAAYEEAASLLRAAGEDLSLAQTLNNLGQVALATGDLDGAGRAFESALPTFRAASDARGTAQILNNLGQLARVAGDAVAAESLCREALDIYEQLEDVQSTAYVLHELGEIALTAGDPAAARERFQRSIEMLRAVSDAWAEAQVLLSLAAAEETRGDAEMARGHREASVAIQERLGITLG